MPPILVSSSAKRIAAQILVIEKLNGWKILIWEVVFMIWSSQQTITCSSLATKAQE